MITTDTHPLWTQRVPRVDPSRATLFWTDAESGEQLSIELVCSRELLDALVADGFELRPAHATYAPHASCRITAGVDPA
jgi:hypothetical protein